MSNDEHDTLLQQPQPSVSPRTPESIKQFLYDDNEKLSADIISIINEDKKYMLLERKGTRKEKVSKVMSYIAPRSAADERWDEGEEPESSVTSVDANNLRIFLGSITNWSTRRAALQSIAFSRTTSASS